MEVIFSLMDVPVYFIVPLMAVWRASLSPIDNWIAEESSQSQLTLLGVCVCVCVCVFWIIRECADKQRQH